MFEKLDEIVTRYEELETLIADPQVLADQARYKQLLQEHSRLAEIVEAYRKYRAIQDQIAESKDIIQGERDPEMRAMAQEELESLESQRAELESTLKSLLIPRDPMDSKNTILEIRAGTGGEEAALFAADLYRMYSRYAEFRNWKTEIMNSNPTEIGGFKELTVSVSGKNAYGDLKYESGVHRVQRVPTTESGGRIHTSAVTVAVLPEVKETEIEIKPEDIRMDVFRSSGPGGQSVNTTDSAVRLTHLPTGTVVSCQDEKSQHKNRAKALRILTARLYEAEEARKRAERAEARKSQIGSGDRSQRIRTYNFPQNRVTDHRINLTLYKLDSVLEGDLDEIIEPIKLRVREEELQAQT